MIARGLILQPENSIDIEPDALIFSDLSRYHNDGTIAGAAWAQLPSGLWCQDLDGVDDVISWTTQSFARPYVSVECWIYPNEQVNPTGTGAFIWSYGVDHQDRVGIRDFQLNNGDLELFDDINDDGLTTQIIPALTWGPMRHSWHHMVVTITATNKAVYMDGVEVLAPDGSTHSMADIGAGAKFHISNLVTIAGALSANAYWHGRIAYPHIYSYILSIGQIRQRIETTKHWLGVHD